LFAKKYIIINYLKVGVVGVGMKKIEREVTCKKCNHKWITKSKLKIVVCASCGSKNRIKK
jgi:Zn finger protein HypA/HybF involved in hydrogenase expression